VGQTAAPLRPARAAASTTGWPMPLGTAGSESAASFGPRRRAAASYETTNLVLSKEVSSKPYLVGRPTLFSHDHIHFTPRRFRHQNVYERPDRATCILHIGLHTLASLNFHTSTRMQGDTAYSPHRNPARLLLSSASTTRHFRRLQKSPFPG
jgi:hypothetical protein